MNFFDLLTNHLQVKLCAKFFKHLTMGSRPNLILEIGTQKNPEIQDTMSFIILRKRGLELKIRKSGKMDNRFQNKALFQLTISKSRKIDNEFQNKALFQLRFSVKVSKAGVKHAHWQKFVTVRKIL